MNELDQLKQELEELKDELENFDQEEQFKESLDEWQHIEIAGIDFAPSEILKECDPIAYSCSLSDYEDEGRSDLEDRIRDLKYQIEEEE